MNTNRSNSATSRDEHSLINGLFLTIVLKLLPNFGFRKT